MLNFIIGRNNSGKTEKIRALIAERASENKKVYTHSARAVLV